jgi:prepilin-type N-terminal cleavage/methylation domain-containing protein
VARRSPGAGRAGVHPGFTLVEVMVALALSGLVLLGARRLLEELADSAGRLTTSAAALDREANAERLLRTLVANMEVGSEQAGPFSGAERETRFTTWCDVPAGWRERCEVRLAVTDATAGRRAALTATLPSGEVVTLADGFHAGSFRYLNDLRGDGGGEWFISWGAGITAPLALGILLERRAGPHGVARVDTLILRIGERG